MGYAAPAKPFVERYRIQHHVAPQHGLKPGPDPMRHVYPAFKASLFTKAKTALATSVSYDYLFGPVFDQGAEGSCVSNGSAALMLAFRRKRRNEAIMVSRRAIYTRALENDGAPQPFQDNGLNVSDGLTVCEEGYIPEALWPYTSVGLPQFFDVPPASLWKNDFTMTNYVTVLPDPLDMQRALIAHGPIIIGLNFANEWMDTGADGILATENLTVDGGHCMVITGFKYIDGALHFRVRNSWGASWADNGYCWLPAALAGTEFWPSDLFTSVFVK